MRKGMCLVIRTDGVSVPVAVSCTNDGEVMYDRLFPILPFKGCFDIVRVSANGKELQMFVDDEGALNGSPLNPVASAMYGNPIFGDVLLLRDRGDECSYVLD